MELKKLLNSLERVISGLSLFNLLVNSLRFFVRLLPLLDDEDHNSSDDCYTYENYKDDGPDRHNRGGVFGDLVSVADSEPNSLVLPIEDSVVVVEEGLS